MQCLVPESEPQIRKVNAYVSRDSSTYKYGKHNSSLKNSHAWLRNANRGRVYQKFSPGLALHKYES